MSKGIGDGSVSAAADRHDGIVPDSIARLPHCRDTSRSGTE